MPTATIRRRLAELQRHDGLEAGVSIADIENLTGNENDTVFNRLSPADFGNAINSNAPQILFRAIEPGRFRNDVSIGGSGEYLVDRDLVESLRMALGDFSPMRRTSTILTRPAGMQRILPMLDDLSVEATLIPPGGQNTAADVPFQGVSLAAFAFASPRLRISRTLLSDSPQLASNVMAILGSRMGRGQNRQWTVGVGGGNYPAGIVTTAPVGVVTASKNGIELNELLTLISLVPTPYRDRASWMMNANTWLTLKLLTDSNGRPLWRTSGLDEWPIITNSHMPSIAANSLPIVFGDVSTYSIIDVGPTVLKVLNEAYAEKDEVGFELWSFANGGLADPSGLAVQSLKMGSS